MSGNRQCRLAVVASHPIQYFTPLYQRLALLPEIQLDVFFCRDFGARPRFDKQFNQTLAWDTDLLGGYRHRFLWNASPIRDTFNPLHAINPGAFSRLLAGYDAVLLNGYAYPSNWLAALAAALRNTRCLVSSDLRIMDRPRRWFDPLRDRLIRSWIRHADALLYIGEANREAYIHYGAREYQLHFAPLGVDVAALERASLRAKEQRQEKLRALGLPTNRRIILFVGKLFDRKQPAAMLHLASHPELISKIHVVLAGSGPLSASLEAECQSRGLANVTQLGFVNQTKLPDLYALADVFVMPSLREPWGIVLSEAMAAGAAPVVSRDVGAARDLIRDGETGFTFAPKSWDVMANCVITLVNNERQRQQIATAAQLRSMRFSYQSAVDGIVEALASLGLFALAS